MPAAAQAMMEQWVRHAQTTLENQRVRKATRQKGAEKKMLLPQIITVFSLFFTIWSNQLEHGGIYSDSWMKPKTRKKMQSSDDQMRRGFDIRNGFRG
jgi:hypothetical protein